MVRTERPLPDAQPPDRTNVHPFRQETAANAGVWGIILVMWLLSFVGVIMSLFTEVDLNGLGFISWVVFLGGIALAFFIGLRGS